MPRCIAEFKRCINVQANSKRHGAHALQRYQLADLFPKLSITKHTWTCIRQMIYALAQDVGVSPRVIVRIYD